ncbi:MAG: hypothetical protein ACR2FK_08405 [Sphingomicrobium sp.]
MRPLVALFVIGLLGCGQQPEANKDAATVQAPAAMPRAQPTMAQKSTVVPIPAEKAQLQRLEAMGYTVHDTHLHLPGVKECPMDMAGSPIQ